MDEKDTKAIYQSVVTKGMFGGGTPLCLGRILKAYPKKDYLNELSPVTGKPIIQPPTSDEIKRAFIWSGFQELEYGQLRKKEYRMTADMQPSDSIEINVSAEAGFPTGGRLSNSGVRDKVFDIADLIRGRLEGKNKRDMERELNKLEKEHPEMFAFKGKCKTDMYKISKLNSCELRFYCASPGSTRVLNSQSFQRFSEHATNITDDPETGKYFEVRTAKGATLAYGGAHKLVSTLGYMVDLKGFAATTTGDDTWIVIRTLDGMVNMSLDASNFDLTQSRAVREGIIERIAEELHKIDPVSALIWKRYHLDRLVVMFNQQVFRMKHAGPSGLNGQSEINDNIESVVVQRFEKRVIDYFGMTTLPCGATCVNATLKQLRAFVEWTVPEVGATLGLDMRIDDYDAIYYSGEKPLWDDRGEVDPVATEYFGLLNLLEKIPFKYVGYMFFVVNGRVCVVCDLPRSIAGILYPNKTWIEEKTFKPCEAIRVASTVLQMGSLPPRASIAAKVHVQAMLETYKKEVENLPPDEARDMLYFGSVAPKDTVASIDGLSKAIDDLDNIWAVPWLPNETEEHYNDPLSHIVRYPDLCPPEWLEKFAGLYRLAHTDYSYRSSDILHLMKPGASDPYFVNLHREAMRSVGGEANKTSLEVALLKSRRVNNIPRRMFDPTIHVVRVPKVERRTLIEHQFNMEDEAMWITDDHDDEEEFYEWNSYQQDEDGDYAERYIPDETAEEWYERMEDDRRKNDDMEQRDADKELEEEAFLVADEVEDVTQPIGWTGAYSSKRGW